MEVLRIKDLIAERGMSSVAVADALGITKTSFSLIANGKRQPRYELLIQIAEILDVDIRDLFHPTKEDASELQDLFVRNEKGEFVKVGAVKLDACTSLISVDRFLIY